MSIIDDDDIRRRRSSAVSKWLTVAGGQEEGQRKCVRHRKEKSASVCGSHSHGQRAVLDAHCAFDFLGLELIVGRERVVHNQRVACSAVRHLQFPELREARAAAAV